MQRCLRAIALLLLLCLEPVVLNAADIHVSSIAALQTAINGASAGDVIYLANGTYLNNTISVGTSNITVRAATLGGVYLNGTNTITISGNYVTFSGFQFTSGSIPGIVITVAGSYDVLTQLNFDGYSAQKYINLQGQYDEVSWSNFRNKPSSAPAGNLIHIAPNGVVPNYAKIRYCSFQRMPGAGGDNGNECIRIANGAQSSYASRTLVEYCYFDSTGPGDSEVISVKCRENVIRFNTNTNNQHGNFCFRNGDNNVAYGNFFINAGGIRVKVANNIYCYNNYFQNCGDGSITAPVKYVFDPAAGVPHLGNLNFIHNTFVDGTPIELDANATFNIWANNIFKKSSGSIFTGSAPGISWAGNIYLGTLGISIPSGMKNADPKLVLNSDNYYGLSSTSPAIDSASASYYPILDITNIDDDPSILYDIQKQSRPVSVTLKDVGCDEYTTGTITNRPLKLSDVGPIYFGTDTITASSGANGTISPSGTVTVSYGSNRTFTMSPSTGYRVDSVIVDGVKVDSTTSYTFVSITTNHTIRAVFASNQVTISATAGSNGAIAPSGAVSVPYGTDQTFSIAPATGYHVDSLLVDEVKTDSTMSYTFKNVTAAHTIRAVFAINQYAITATAGAGGTIAPSGIVTLNYGAVQSFSISPGTGYHVDSVVVDGVKVDSVTSYTFSSISANHTIRVVFKIVQYAIMATAGTNGMILPSGPVNVNHGSNQQFTIAPSTGCHVDSVIVDGLNTDSTTSYTFINVTAGHTIRVVFRINSYTITATSGPNGTISPPGATILNYGASQRYLFNPSTGYHVDSVIIDGGEVDSLQGYTFNFVSANHSIRVTFSVNQFTVDASAGPNGSINPAGIVWLSYGETRRFTFTPSTGYHADSVIVDGGWVDSASGYTFSSAAANHSIRVTFAINRYTVTASSGANGTITPDGNVPVTHGDTLRFTFVPALHYHLDSLIVDDVRMDSSEGYTFAGISANHSIRVTFSIDRVILSASSGLHGTITPAGDVPAGYGDALRFTFSPSPGYHVDSVFVDGVRVDSTGGYTFRNIVTEHSIRVTFAIDVFVVTPVAGLHGAIVPPAPVEVSYGSDQRFTFHPDADYQVDSVLIDGIPVDSLQGYTFTEVTSSHVIRCVFTRSRSLVQLSVAQRWNMISVPVRVSDAARNVLFPTSVSKAFEYQNGYVLRETLSVGTGYWLKFNSSQVISLQGSPCYSDTIHLQQQWNMVGSITLPVSVADIIAVTPGLVLSQFFGYAGAYAVVDSIKPGHGYWVKANTPGQIVLRSAPSARSSAQVRILQTPELPPPPPGVTVENATVPARYALEQNFPNPFNPATTIRYALPNDARVNIRVFDVLGREIVTLVNEEQRAGFQMVRWDASDVPSGAYYCRMYAVSTVQGAGAMPFMDVKSLLLVK